MARLVAPAACNRCARDEREATPDRFHWFLRKGAATRATAVPVAAKDGFPEVCAFWAPELMHLVVRACGPLHSAAHLASSTPLCDARICPDFCPRLGLSSAGTRAAMR